MFYLDFVFLPGSSLPLTAAHHADEEQPTEDDNPSRDCRGKNQDEIVVGYESIKDLNSGRHEGNTIEYESEGGCWSWRRHYQ